jgi:molybdate transport system ATP-binding protein
MRDGKVIAFGAAEDVLRAPEFGDDRESEGGALIEAVVVEHDRENALTVLAGRASRLYVPQIDVAVGARARLRIRARDVMIALRPPEQISALNVIPGRITAASPVGPGSVLIDIDCAGDRIAARLTKKSVDALGLRPGLDIFAVLKSVAFDSSSVAGAPASRPAEP